MYMQKLGKERMTHMVGTFRKGENDLADPSKEF